MADEQKTFETDYRTISIKTSDGSTVQGPPAGPSNKPSPPRRARPDGLTGGLRGKTGTTVQGKVNISPNQRVSELFTAQKGPFVVMVEATFGEVSNKTLFINKDHIIWVEPED